MHQGTSTVLRSQPIWYLTESLALDHQVRVSCLVPMGGHKVCQEGTTEARRSHWRIVTKEVVYTLDLYIRKSLWNLKVMRIDLEQLWGEGEEGKAPGS